MGLALILAPFALVCALIAVLVAPKAALILAVVGGFTILRQRHHRKDPDAEGSS
jgi:hypothetical protein